MEKRAYRLTRAKTSDELEDELNELADDGYGFVGIIVLERPIVIMNKYAK